MRRECGYTTFNLFALAAIAFAFMFEVVVIDQRMATRHELLRCAREPPAGGENQIAIVGWLVGRRSCSAHPGTTSLNRRTPRGDGGDRVNWRAPCGAPSSLFALRADATLKPRAISYAEFLLG